MTSIDHSTLVTQLWTEIEALSLDDVRFYIDNCSNLLEPDSKLTCVLVNPGSFNTSVILALILLHRYDIMHSPSDILRASKLMLQSISPTQEPGYDFFIFTLASRSLDLFEENMGLNYLGSSIELLEHFVSIRKHGSTVHFMAVVKLSCAYLQYYLKIDNDKQTLQLALNSLTEGKENFPECRWISSFGEFNSLFIVADVLRHRYEVFGRQSSVDLEGTASAVLSILDLLHTHQSNHCTVLEALVLCTMLSLARMIDCNNWSEVLEAIHCVTAISLPRQPMVGSLSHLPSEATLSILSKFISQCPTTPTNRAICLIYMADILERAGTPSQKIVGADDKAARSLWEKQWIFACRHLQNAIYCLQTGISMPNPTLNLKQFHFQTKVNNRSTHSRTIFRQLHPADTHICMFDFVPIPVGEGNVNDIGKQVFSFFFPPI